MIDSMADASQDVLEKTRRILTGMADPAPPAAAACCSTAEQEVCCEASEKAACCGTGMSSPAGCGCR